MECMYLSPIPEDGDYTPVSEIHWLGPDDDYTEAHELGMLAKIFNQDIRNLEHVYAGMPKPPRGNTCALQLTTTNSSFVIGMKCMKNSSRTPFLPPVDQAVPIGAATGPELFIQWIL